MIIWSYELIKACKHGGNERLIKIVFKNGVQKWRCKECGKYQGAVDSREKYTEADKKAALSLYLEGVGFRPAAKILSKSVEMLRLSAPLLVNKFNSRPI